MHNKMIALGLTGLLAVSAPVAARTWRLFVLPTWIRPRVAGS